MTLEQSTQALLQAIEAQDLEAIAASLEARAKAMVNPAMVSHEAFEAGEQALQALLELQQRWASESARLRQISEAFSHTHPAPGSRLDFMG
jgi:hypothetical protein